MQKNYREPTVKHAADTLTPSSSSRRTMLAEGTKVPPHGGQQNICETCSSQTIEQDGGRIDRGNPR